MIKIKFIDEAEIGDFIYREGRMSIISSIQPKGEYYIIELMDGEVIVLSKDQRAEIFRVKSRP